MVAEPKKIHNRHERWCTEFALQLCCRVSPHRVLLQHLVVDAVVQLDTTKDLWADLTPYLIDRDVLVEHFSDSVNTVGFANCAAKLAHMLQSHERVPLKERGQMKAPSLVILSHRRPDRLLREPGLFEATQTQGIWVRRPIDLGAMFLVATTHLPSDPRYDWYRISTRIPDTADEFRMAHTLMREQKLARLKQVELEELIMEFIIDGKTPIELKAELKEERLLRLAADQQRLAADQQRNEEKKQRLVAEEEIQELKAQLAQLLKNQK